MSRSKIVIIEFYQLFAYLKIDIHQISSAWNNDTFHKFERDGMSRTN